MRLHAIEKLLQLNPASALPVLIERLCLDDSQMIAEFARAKATDLLGHEAAFREGVLDVPL